MKNITFIVTYDMQSYSARVNLPLKIRTSCYIENVYVNSWKSTWLVIICPG